MFSVEFPHCIMSIIINKSKISFCIARPPKNVYAFMRKTVPKNSTNFAFKSVGFIGSKIDKRVCI